MKGALHRNSAKMRMAGRSPAIQLPSWPGEDPAIQRQDFMTEKHEGMNRNQTLRTAVVPPPKPQAEHAHARHQAAQGHAEPAPREPDVCTYQDVALCSSHSIKVAVRNPTLFHAVSPSTATHAAKFAANSHAMSASSTASTA
jgi:hypothetical protein